MRKIRKLAVLYSTLVLMLCFTTVAYASDGKETPGETTPFTPAGTGTVIDNATNEDGKLFYTIITPDENIFYLVIDLQRETDNVYFLNAVTEKDLLPLAENSGDTQDGENNLGNPKPENSSNTTYEPEASAEPSPETEQKNNAGMLLIVLAVVVIGGGTGYYFKIYRPKHQKADSEDDFNYGDGSDFEDMESEEQSDELPPWEDENNGNSGDDEA
jgi:hypothetical protein